MTKYGFSLQHKIVQLTPVEYVPYFSILAVVFQKWILRMYVDPPSPKILSPFMALKANTRTVLCGWFWLILYG